MSRTQLLIMVVTLLIVAPSARAQVERFELGQRLRAFEVAWEKQSDEAARKRAVEPLIQATTAFFSFRLGEAGRQLDQARFAVESRDEPIPGRRWANSLYATLPHRLLDKSVRQMTFSLQPFYKVDGPPPAKVEWRGRLWTEIGDKVLAESIGPIDELPLAAALSWKDAPEGDHRLRIEIVVDGAVLSSTEQTVSIVADVKSRLAVLKKLPHEEAFRTVEAQTFGELRKVVQSLADGKTLETNYPAARFLAEAEALPEAIRKGENYYAWPKAGQFWLGVAAGSTKETVRLFVPEKLAQDRKTPLVIALHGAGGSENMFFDGYGAGKIVRLCQERGWVLVAPRLSPFAAAVKTEDMVAELARRWPIDPQRVFLVGHSMGAMQAVQTATRIPEKLAGVAALGGGQKINAERAAALPFFLGVGSRDFALRGVKSLRESLADAEVKTVVFREYPDLEHLVIVQQALPDVFAFFDGIAKQR